MDRVTANARMTTLLAVTQVVQRSRNICILILSAAAFLPILSAMSNYRIIFQKKRLFYLVCAINDVIKYAVVTTVLVSLHLNECHIPTARLPYPYERYM